MNRDQRRLAKQQFLRGMFDGLSWHEAAAHAGLPIKRSAAYLLWRRFHLEGDTALDDHRHGHPAKVRPEVRDWIVQACRADPARPSHDLQAAIQAHFALTISVGHLNHVRAALDLATLRVKKKP